MKEDELIEGLEYKIRLRPIPKVNTKGIYVLLNNEEIVYIGQSTNIPARIFQHLTEGKKIFNYYDFFEFDLCEEDLLELETKLIKKYKPRYNSVNNDELKLKVGELITPSQLRKLYGKMKSFNETEEILRKLNKLQHINESNHYTVVALKKAFGHYNKKPCSYTEGKYIQCAKAYLKQFPIFNNRTK